MTDWEIGSAALGRIAERIVANELERLGFRVTALNREGNSDNADLLAARTGTVYQVQVKGANNNKLNGKQGIWWATYGFCNQEIIAHKEDMFNRKKAFYNANVIVLVAVRNLREYRCVVMPVEEAEKAAQYAMDHGYRNLTLDGKPKRPHIVWTALDKPRGRRDKAVTSAIEAEYAIVKKFRDNWDWLLPGAGGETPTQNLGESPSKSPGVEPVSCGHQQSR